MKRIIFIALIFFSVPTFAAQYRWTHTNGGTQFDSPLAACSDYVAIKSKPLGTKNSKYMYDPRVTTYTQTQFKCTYTYNLTYSDGSYTPNAAYTEFIYVTRVGDGCENGSVYNPETGECKVNCDAVAGSTIEHEVFQSATYEAFNGTSDPPSSVCHNSCIYQWEFTVSDIYTYVSGTPAGIFASFPYKAPSVGQSCTAETVKTPGDGKGPPDPTDPSNNCPKGWQWSGTTCVKAPDPEPDPDPDPDDPDNPDNPGDGGDDGGDPGDGGDGDGNGDGNGNGDGSGDGDGTGEGEGEGECESGQECEEEETSGSASGSCDAPPSCSGDPIPCAILKQQWHTMCAGEEVTASKLRSGLTAEGMVDADTLDDVLGKNSDDISGKISSIVNGTYTAGPSNTCPVKDFTFGSPWGVIKIPFSVNCPIFNVISAVIFFLSYLAAGWILFEALVRGK